MADTTERHIALREAHQIGASDSFFAARKELRDTEHERYIFDAGFRRGFDCHESLQRKATATKEGAAMASEQDEKLADFQTMYAMLKVHSANQAKEIERLKEWLSTPSADAALADDAIIELVTDYAQSKVRAESCRYRYESGEYDKEAAETLEQIRAALRARQPEQAVAVPDYLVCAIEDATHPKHGTYLSVERRNALADALKRALLASSKGGAV